MNYWPHIISTINFSFTLLTTNSYITRTHSFIKQLVIIITFISTAGILILIIISDWIWENPTFCIIILLRFCYNYYSIYMYSVWITSLLSMRIYSTSELQHFVNIVNIEGGKLACANTQNRTLFKMLGFCRSGHI